MKNSLSVPCKKNSLISCIQGNIHPHFIFAINVHVRVNLRLNKTKLFSHLNISFNMTVSETVNLR